MPKFDKSKRYKDKNGHTFGKGVWYDDNGKMIRPGIGYEIDRKTRTISQYNSDGTITHYPWEKWAEKKVKEGELQVLRNDRNYGIPFIPEKKITISIDKNSPTRNNAGATFSENLLDSIAVNAKKAGLPFSTALGIVAKESTFGAGERGIGKTFLPWNRALNQGQSPIKQEAKRISYQGVQSPSLLVSNWKQRNAVPFHDYFYNGQGQLLDNPVNAEFYDEDINSSRRKSNNYHLEEASPLFHAFRDYRQNPYNYNHNDKNYPDKVKVHTNELVNYSPEIQEYMKKHNLHGGGGPLEIPKTWDNLSMAEKSDMIRVAVENGITTLPEIRKAYNEFAEGGGVDTINTYGTGGYKPSESIKSRIAQYEGKAMTGARDPISGKWGKNNSFEAEARGFYKALPVSIREQVLSNPELADSLYSYSYNVGAGNFKKRVVPALERYYAGIGSVKDIEDSMWATHDSKLRGLQRRRAEEKAGVRNALMGEAMPLLQTEEVPEFTPFNPQAFSAFMGVDGNYRDYTAPQAVDVEEPLVQAAMESAYSPEQIEREERAQGLRNLGLAMSIMRSNENYRSSSLWDTVGLLTGNQFKSGGKIHIKPENRGKFTVLKKRTGHSATWFKEHGTPAQKKMATFALNAKKWKHGLGGNLFSGEDTSTQQMNNGLNLYRRINNLGETEYIYQETPDSEEILLTPTNKRFSDDPTNWDYKDASGREYSPRMTATYNPGEIREDTRGPLERMVDNYFGELKYQVNNNVPISGKYTMPAIAAAPFLAWAGEAAYPYVSAALTNPYVDAGITSAFAGHGLDHAINEGINGWGDAAMTAMELMPLGKVAKPAISSVTNAAKNLYDNGTLWDAYTTFNGRLGNYGDNLLTNIYGTAARRFGFPDKARIPADAIRKISDSPKVDNDFIDLTGNKNWLGNPHINLSIDRPVVSHPNGGWDGADTYLFPFKDYLKETAGALKSIEPSDVFSNGVAFMENPSKVTLISGDTKALKEAQKAGMQTLSSPRLRRLYSKAEQNYNSNKLLNKHPKKEWYWKDYATEVQRLQSQRGTPTIADFNLLEEKTGLNSGVAPLYEYDNALKGLRDMQKLFDTPGGIRAIMNGEVFPYIYPNGREVEWSIQGVQDELNALQRAKYNKVFYDPTSHVESDWRSLNR